MTQPATRPPTFTPLLAEAPSLEQLVDELTALWNDALQAGQREAAVRVFNDHPGAREDQAQALRTRAALHSLLGHPHAGTAHATSVPVPEPEGETALPLECSNGEAGTAPPADGEDAECDGPPGEGATVTGDEPATPPVAPTPAPHTDPGWPEGTLGVGFLSALAATLASGEGLQLNLGRAGGTLHVTITPRRALGEPGSTAQPLVVSGTPAELDADMLSALSVYGAARMTARDAANELLRRTHEAAERARQQKTAAPPTSQRASQTAEERTAQAKLNAQASLIVGAPEGAVITLTDADGGTQVLTSGLAVKLDPQKVTLKIEAEGYEPLTSVFPLRARERKHLTPTLKPAPQSSLF